MTLSERRKFKRLHAPVVCRPQRARLVTEEGKRHVQDISLGGLRVYTDDPHQVGEHLELELFLPEGGTLTLDTRICWVDSLAPQGPAKFEVGLQYLDVAAEDLARIERLLKDE